MTLTELLKSQYDSKLFVHIWKRLKDRGVTEIHDLDSPKGSIETARIVVETWQEFSHLTSMENFETSIGVGDGTLSRWAPTVFKMKKNGNSFGDKRKNA